MIATIFVAFFIWKADAVKSSGSVIGWVALVEAVCLAYIVGLLASG